MRGDIGFGKAERQPKPLILVVLSYAAVAVGAFIAGGYFEQNLRTRWFPKQTTAMQVLVDGTGVNGGGPSLQLNMNGRPLGWIAINPDTRAYLLEELAKLP